MYRTCAGHSIQFICDARTCEQLSALLTSLFRIRTHQLALRFIQNKVLPRNLTADSPAVAQSSI